MAAREKTVAAMWVIYASFVTTLFLFIVVIETAKPAEKLISPMIIGAFALAAISYVLVGATLRRKFLNAAEERLRQEPHDAKGLQLWRTGNLLSFAIAESVMLLGVAQKFLGARWTISGIFFALGLLLMILWMPRLDLYPATNPSAAPPPIA
jgi:hypothetical protein